jgi:hypothetical protein
VSSILFDYMALSRLENFQTEMKKVEAQIESLEDFKIQIRWEFDSSILPLINKIAPGDTITIWKKGKSLRLDSNFVGYKHFKNKRRPISLIFNPINLQEKPIPPYNTIRGTNISGSLKNFPSKLVSVNHTKRKYTGLFSAISLEEKRVIMHDLLTSVILNTKTIVKHHSFKHQKTLFGKQVSEKLYGRNTEKLGLKLEIESQVRRKHKEQFGIGLKEYLKGYKVSDNDLSFEDVMGVGGKGPGVGGSLGSSLNNVGLGAKGEKNLVIDFNKKSYKFKADESVTKSVGASIWMCKDYRINLNVIFFGFN